MIMRIASDYHDVSFLKSIADKLKIVIVLIHHLRKQKDDDASHRKGYERTQCKDSICNGRY